MCLLETMLLGKVNLDTLTLKNESFSLTRVKDNQ